MTVENITIRHLLPDVFVGMESTDAIAASEVWCVPSFTFTRGCKLLIQAESGQGKSSLLSYIYGNRDDYRGVIDYDGVDIRRFSIGEWCGLRSRNIALLPQEMRLFPELTVIGNIEIKNKLTGHKTAAQVDAMLERLGIADKKHQLVGHLSIGQQQRVALIRSLCQPFDFIFLDEPVSHLDQRNNQVAARLVEEEAGAQGAGIISTSVGNNLALTDPKIIRL